MFCRNCGNKIIGPANFCPYCGEKLTYTCPKCGHALSEGELFCAECGTRVIFEKEPKTVRSEFVNIEDQNNTVPSDNKIMEYNNTISTDNSEVIIKCPYCGKKQKANRETCYSCSKPLRSTDDIKNLQASPVEENSSTANDINQAEKPVLIEEDDKNNISKEIEKSDKQQNGNNGIVIVFGLLVLFLVVGSILGFSNFN